jgi:hypothetical protein
MSFCERLLKEHGSRFLGEYDDLSRALWIAVLTKYQAGARTHTVEPTQWGQHRRNDAGDGLAAAQHAGVPGGTVKKKLGFSLTSVKPNDGVRRYRIETRRVR